MYKYTIFVIVIIMIIDNPVAVFIYFVLVSVFFILSVFPSLVRCKLNFKYFLL